MGPSAQEDSALIQAVLSGDPASWERFVGAFGGAIYSVCVSLVGATHADEVFSGYFGELRRGDFRALRGFQASRGRLVTYLVCDAHTYGMQRVLADFLHRPEAVEAVWTTLEGFYKPQLLRTIEFVLQRAGHRDLLAADLYQHLLIHLMEDNCARLRKFSGEGAFSAWVRQVATNFVLDRLRATRSRSFVPISSSGPYEEAARGELQPAVDPPDPAPLPDQQIEERQAQALQEGLQQVMGQALQELSERSQLCLRIKYWEGHKPAEMADLLGEPVAKVYKTLEKNMEKLRLKMGAHSPGGKIGQPRPTV